MSGGPVTDVGRARRHGRAAEPFVADHGGTGPRLSGRTDCGTSCPTARPQPLAADPDLVSRHHDDLGRKGTAYRSGARIATAAFPHRCALSAPAVTTGIAVQLLAS